MKIPVRILLLASEDEADIIIPRFIYATSAEKERGDLLGIDVAFSIKMPHFEVITAQGMDTAGIIGSDDQQFTLCFLLPCEGYTFIIFVCPISQCLCCFREFLSDTAG